MNNRKTKLFICITKSNWGGAQKYVFDLATNIPGSDYDITVLLGGNGDLAKNLEKAGIRVINLAHSQRDIDVGKEFNLFFELIKIFKKEKPDIIHLNSSKMGGVGALAGRICGIKKIIFTAHGWAFNEDRNWIEKTAIRFLHIITIILCHSTIAVSEITKKQIGEPWNKKMTVVRNGLRSAEFLDKETAMDYIFKKISIDNPCIKNVLDKKPVWIGTISELHKTKGLEYSIQAVSKIDNCVFFIIGDGEEKENIEKLILELGLDQKVFLLGRIESASSYLKAFDVFTLTSITEALPYALIEASSAELPVIASCVGGIPEIIEDKKTGILVSPKNSGEIISALNRLINCPEEREIFGQAAKNKIDTEFNFKKTIENTIKLYK